MNRPSPTLDRLWPAGAWLLLLAVAGIPVSLLWDFSWEATVGVDQFWAPAHALGYLAVGLAGVTAVVLMLAHTRAESARDDAVCLARLRAPLGVWLTLWGALAFAAALLFDQWWQSAYGLAAGLWHPPQISKAVSFFAVVMGAWLLTPRTPGSGGRWSFPVAGGVALALITAMTLTLNYPNRQHAASFYLLACATYPIVLTALAGAGRGRWTATAGAVIYSVIVCATVWLLPLVPARPLTGPIHNPLDHLTPPPFPLLLIFPAVTMDVLRWWLPAPAPRAGGWGRAVVLGAAFCFIFLGVQWTFAEFLLTDLADNRFFAGGGRHWPFFLKIDPLARTQFWLERDDIMNITRTLGAFGLAVIAARLGLGLGAWMGRLRR